MSFKIALCDISKENQKSLKRRILDFDENAEVVYFNDGETLICAKEQFDAVFFNFDSDDEASLDMAVKLRIHKKSTPFVIYSTNPKRIGDASKLRISKVLYFPIKDEILFELLRIIKSRAKDNFEYVFPIKDGQRRIRAGNIVYVDGKDPYRPVIHLTNGENIAASEIMDQLVLKLKSDSFIRVHKSYIVSLRYINELCDEHITMQYTNTDIPVERKYRNKTKEKFYEEIRSRAVLL